MDMMNVGDLKVVKSNKSEFICKMSVMKHAKGWNTVKIIALTI